MGRPRRAATLTVLCALLASTVTGTTTAARAVSAPAREDAGVSQPAQPTTGPGGSAHRFDRMRVTSGGKGADAWYLFEPRSPKPRSAPVAVVLHGYYEFSGYAALQGLIRHTVLRGSIVIYPRWQTDIAVPCPGPYNIEPCIDSAVAGIRGALRSLERRPGAVRPRLDKVTYWGSSFGGIIATNLANRFRDLDLPRPRALFLDDPHDSGRTGPDEPSVDDDLSGIPATTRIQCHVGAAGIIGEPGKSLSSCNAIFPKLDHVPARNKDLVLTHDDTYGDPDLYSRHMVCYSRPGEIDAYDYNFCWKVWDALRSSAYRGTHSPYAFGNTPEHTSMGFWSDGTPITPLKVQDEAPIAP